MTDVWNRKMLTCFKRFDFDNVGFLTKKTWEDVGESIIKGGNLKGQRAEAVRNSVLQVHFKAF